MSTKTVILRELQRGGDVVDKIFTKQLSWSDLFTRHTFFTNDYKYYLSITASSKTKEDEAVWSGLVESKLRHLVGALDRKPIIAVAHPFPKGFERVHQVASAEEMEEVKNGSTKYQAKGTSTETTDEIKDPAHEAAAQNGMENATVLPPADTSNQSAPKPEGPGQTVYTTTYYIGLELKPLEPGRSPSPYLKKLLARSLLRALTPIRCVPVSGHLHRLAYFQVDMHLLVGLHSRHS